MNISLTAIRTRPFLPPRDDVEPELIDKLGDLKEKDIVVVTSKIIAIAQGRCVPIESTDKTQLIQQEADAWLPRQTSRYGVMLTIKENTLIAAAGIDESNSQGYYTLWPEQPSAWARDFCQKLKQKHKLSDLAVIVTDSHCVPMRWGVVGISIGFYGLEPLKDYRGQPDIFGRPLRFTQANIVEAISVTAVAAMGEGSECTPAVIVRGWPKVVFTDVPRHEDVVIDPKDDIFAPLLSTFSSTKK